MLSTQLVPSLKLISGKKGAIYGATAAVPPIQVEQKSPSKRRAFFTVCPGFFYLCSPEGSFAPTAGSGATEEALSAAPTAGVALRCSCASIIPEMVAMSF